MNIFNYYDSRYQWESTEICHRRMLKTSSWLKYFFNTLLLMLLVFFSHLVTAESYASVSEQNTNGAPVVNSRFTNQAPKWSWQTSYQINIQDDLGNTVYEEVIGDVEQFVFNDGLFHRNSYKARVRGSIDNGNTWGEWSDFSLLTTVDLVEPTVTVDSFVRTGIDSVKVSYSAEDDLSGLANGHLQIAEDSDFNNIVFDEVISVENNSFEATGLPVGNLLYTRIKVTDTAGNESNYTTPLAIAITKPVIVQPVNNSIIRQAELIVSGTAEVGGQLKLYLNNELVNQSIQVDETGNFLATLQLAEEGDYSLVATVENNYEVSEPSPVVNFTYVLPVPKAIFVTPAEGLELTAATDIEVSAIDELGISKVEFFIDEVLFATITEAPYVIHWDVSAEQNGEHVLKAVVTNNSNKSATITRQVTVKVEPPAPPPTVYTGKLLSITPEVTYGLQPITIVGQAVYRADESLVANVPLKLVLIINGFERKINVVTDVEGSFTYNFMPQEIDVGSYQVAVIHPNETIAVPQGGFAINRIKFNLIGFDLKAIRNVTSEIKVNATASVNTTGLRWLARAEDQDSGSLPHGITIDGGSGVSISANRTVTTVIKFTADDTAAQYGTINLVAVANESGDLVRGRLQLNYQLGEATANIFATPTYIQTSTQQGDVITEDITLGNRGLIAAEDVEVSLVDAEGNLPPNWVFIANETSLGELAVGGKAVIQLMAQPDENVTDGIYRFNINVTSTNSTGGTIPVTIAITQSGQGTVRFDVADIYTNRPNENGELILGVAGATIKLQNEAVLTEEYNVTTDSQGIATLTDLPPGIYRYRASAENHMDASGRVVIRANATVNEHIFLEYETINIEFGVNETTVEDIYDIEVEATFNTQVPAPVVLLEPLSINLAGMLPGEERTGEITLTNYGLVQAENVIFNAPKSDTHFQYEFFGEVPEILLPKTRIVIPYKVTARAESQFTRSKSPLTTMLAATASRAVGCSSYSASYSESHQSECASGDISSGSSSGNFYSLTGSSCSGSSIGGGWGTGSPGVGGAGFGGGPSSSPPAIPLSSGCTPDCTEDCCGTGGGGAANE